MLAAIFVASIEELTGDDYSEAQQLAWAGTADDEERFGARLASELTLVATLQGLDITQLVITHDLPFALELCERSIILDSGRVVADGDTSAILGDADLLARHRLEMPFGYRATGIS